MIDQNTVERIINTAQIVDVVQDFVNLKRRGVNFLGLCPFHNEKTPSFTVSPAKGIFKCFGCGQAGNSVGFIMEHEQLSYPEALKYLAKKYSIDVVETEQTDEQIAQKNERDSMLIVTQYAQKYFHNILHNHREGKAIGLSYFKERGFSKEIINKFQLGYSLEQRDGFTTDALKNGYKIKYLTGVGLSIEKNNYRFDRFAGRVIFPIHGLSGSTIGFGGRVLSQEKKTAKYLNSPESEIYHKSNILYGIYFAKKSIVKHAKCYMVEGYTDVISLHQAGIENVVASSGTSLTENQISLVKRFTENLTILYDGDDAGIKASFRGIDMILEQDMNVRVVLFPKGEDPDSFARKLSKTELKEYIDENEQDFIKFKTSLLLQDAKDDPVKRANLVSNIVSSIAIIPDAITRSIYIKECSSLLQVKEDALYAETNKKIFKKREDNRRRNFSKVKHEVKQTQTTPLPGFIDDVFAAVNEKELISLLLNFGELELFSDTEETTFTAKSTSVADYITAEILNDELEFKNLIYKQIFEDYIVAIKKNEQLESKHFINHQEANIRKLAADVLSQNYKASSIWEKDGKKIEATEMRLKEIVPKTVNTYKLKVLNQAIKDNETYIKNAGDDMERIKYFMEQKMTLLDARRELGGLTGDRVIF
ncbi:MAG: DNA primase [Bacteroidetes bacterium 4572_117]|nr:MAG: DNA primase [Bacteroidetes bacterium 4572_117]